MVLNLCHNIACLERCSRCVLLIAMENPGRPELLTALKNEPAPEGAARGVGPGGTLFDCFTDVLCTVHKLRGGEVPGTGSNHSHAQLCAEVFF